VVVAAILHRATRLGSEVPEADRRALSEFRRTDPSNVPPRFKSYSGAAEFQLPKYQPAVKGGRAEMAIELVAEQWSLSRLARLLFLANGVARRYHTSSGDVVHFQTSMSAGNLHPIEMYLVCARITELEAGVYHVGPLTNTLTALRAGDHRYLLGEASGTPDIQRSPVSLVLTGLPWRTAWKYGERGFRHLYWDAGSVVANITACEPNSRLRMAFVDALVADLIGVDGVSEFPLAIVTPPGEDGGGPMRHRYGPANRVEAVASLADGPGPVLSLLSAAQTDGALSSGAEVTGWRKDAGYDDRPTLTWTEPFRSTGAGTEPIDSIILRRGSTRLMTRRALPSATVERALRAAMAPVLGDTETRGSGALVPRVAVQSVEGVVGGSYIWQDELVAGRLVSHARDDVAWLCYGQPVGGDAAFTVFWMTDLDQVLQKTGSRGYRVVHLRAGLAAGRMVLAAFGNGAGATNLTFADDPVAEFFETTDSCLLVTAVGIPAYRNVAGGAPGEPTELAHLEALGRRSAEGRARLHASSSSTAASR
jgi:SagB-type dehydrogenase family enzyme